MKTSKQARREAKQLFRLCQVNGMLDDNRVRRVVQSVLQSRRRGYLTVLRRFLQLVKLEYAMRTARVESAVPLPFDLQAGIRAGVERVYGPAIVTLFGRNPALIGGIRIRIGSDVYDGSLRSSLAALERSFGIPTANGRNQPDAQLRT